MAHFTCPDNRQVNGHVSVTVRDIETQLIIESNDRTVLRLSSSTNVLKLY